MCLSSSPKAPTPAPALPEAAVAPAAADAPNAAKRSAKKRKAGSGTVLTGARGLTDEASTAQNTVLGG